VKHNDRYFFSKFFVCRAFLCALPRCRSTVCPCFSPCCLCCCASVNDFRTYCNVFPTSPPYLWSTMTVIFFQIFRVQGFFMCIASLPFHCLSFFAPSAPFVKTRQQPCLVLTTSPQSRWKEDNKAADTRIIYQLRDEIFTSYYINLNCCISVCYIDLQDRNVICGIYFWMERMRVFERKQN